MIVGEWSPAGEASVRLAVHGPDRVVEVQAVIDTGFDGWLSLPPQEIRALGLVEAGSEEVELADGRVRRIETYNATVQWDGTPQAITVDEAPTEPLLGTELLWGYELRIRYVAGGGVEIEAVPTESSD
jgi:clan AA aspartic protease